MKKILIILFIPLLWACQEKIVPVKERYTPVNVGTTANDGTGDNLRAAFIKVNAGFAEIADSLGNIYTEAQTRALIGDTATVLRVYTGTEINDNNQALLDSAIDIEDYLEDFAGTGGSTSWDIQQFTVGVTTGAPSASDTTYTQTAFQGKNIGLYRDGLRQTRNFTATNTQEGFRFNSTTGVITVLPAWEANEQIILAIDEPINYTFIPIEGQESTLQTDLLGLWKFDEISGTAISDALGVNNGTTTATVNQVGIDGKAIKFDGLGDYARVPYSASLSVTGLDNFSVSAWFYLDSISIANGQNLVCLKTNDANYWSVLLRIDANNAIIFYAKNSSATTYDANTANSAVTTGQWYNVIATLNDGTMKIYLDGVDATTAADTFSGTMFPFNDYVYFGAGSSSSVSYIRGYIDEPALWDKTLSGDEITEIQSSYYPY